MRTFTHENGDAYHVTGVLVNGKRFKIVTSNLMHALSINVWRGSVWQVRDRKPFGRKATKRSLVKRVWN